MRKLLKIVIIIFLIINLIYISYLKYIKKEKLISIYGYNFFIVLSGSMEPEIKTDSLIIIKKLDNYEVRRYYYF